MRGFWRVRLSGWGVFTLAVMITVALMSGVCLAAPQAPVHLPDWEAATYADFPIQIDLNNRAQLTQLLGDVPLAGFDREQVRPTPTGLVFTPRVNAREAAALKTAGYSFTRLPDQEQAGRRAVEAFWAEQQAKGFPTLDPDKALYYPTNAQIGSDFAALAAAHPTIARTFTWGTSVQGRELWGIVISDDVQNTEAEPEVRLSSTMHGDEPVDMVMLWNLAQYLVNNYGQAGFESLTDLVNTTEIHITPLYNPDGYTAGTRTNSNGVDLNRNFPEPAGTHTTQEPENLAFMAYAQAHHFVISQNGHGGSLVVNYPWDYTYTRAPDDAALIDLSLEYSTYNLPMYNGSFPQGITNGADWYVATGTLQDWSYFATDCIDVTIEVSNTKWPAASQLDSYWNDNRESLLHYIQAARYGVNGVVTGSDTGLPLDATVTVTGNSKSVHTDPAHGDYYKLLDTGTYELTFSATGYLSKTISGVNTTWGTPTVLDVVLDPMGPTETLTLFSADFESGTSGWSGGWGLATPATGYNSTNSLTDSPGSNYADNSTNTTTMDASVDLSDPELLSGTLSFWAQWDIEAGYDGCVLEGSTNGGGSWFPVGTDHTHPAGGQGVQTPSGTPVFDGIQNGWVLNTVDLAPVLGQADLRFRFRLSSDSSVNGQGFYFDDFVIQALRPDQGSPVPGAPQLAASINAWPNPFNPSTTVAFALPNAGPVRLNLYDMQGHLVRTLVDEDLPAGQHTRHWDGRNDRGGSVASGIYLARMVSGHTSAVVKLTLMK